MSGSLIKIAILAVGGQGGGVLAGWITRLAEENGFVAQMTSVAGVAQRTGATIYYIEMAPGDQSPVFALSPTPGDVDIVIAAELMEAGRAVQRGFVTPDRTVLITSTHRILAVSEKQVPGDGRGDTEAVLAALKDQANRLVAHNLERPAQAAGSVISASLFGALSQSGALPFPTEAYEAVIRASTRGAEASLTAFRNAGQPEPLREAEPPPTPLGEYEALLAQLPNPSPAAQAGLRKCLDYQDPDYGTEYVELLTPFLNHTPELGHAAAKAIANAMCYDDVIRVADLKTRAARQDRIRAEQEITEGAAYHVTEYLHPRAEEVASTLPAALGAWVTARPWALGLIERLAGKGRRVRSDRIGGFLLLYLLAELRPWRRHLLRHQTERAHLERLIARATAALPERPTLAAEIFACQRLVKGYSDTHARGSSKFARTMEGLDLVWNRDDAADWLVRLRQAALADEDGAALQGALATIRSFTPDAPPLARDGPSV